MYKILVLVYLIPHILLHSLPCTCTSYLATNRLKKLALIIKFNNIVVTKIIRLPTLLESACTDFKKKNTKQSTFLFFGHTKQST